MDEDHHGVAELDFHLVGHSCLLKDAVLQAEARHLDFNTPFPPAFEVRAPNPACESSSSGTAVTISSQHGPSPRNGTAICCYSVRCVRVKTATLFLKRPIAEPSTMGRGADRRGDVAQWPLDIIGPLGFGHNLPHPVRFEEC